MCECTHFVKSSSNSEKCGCGREKQQHASVNVLTTEPRRWNWNQHTAAYPTDSYGTVKFGTGVHGNYIRMSPRTRPEDVVRLLCDQWGAQPPKVIVSVQGGLTNFDLPPKVKRSFRKSLQKMASVPGCWIITNGLNVGIAKHVGDCMTAGFLRRNRAVVIGIAPWGVIAGRQFLKKQNSTVHYFAPSAAPGATVLNPNHSFYLLVDDGTVGRYGQDMRWRQDFETELSKDDDSGQRSLPLVSLLVEGGYHCITSAIDYLTASKPVVVVADSGRAANLICWTLNPSNQATSSEGMLILIFFWLFF